MGIYINRDNSTYHDNKDIIKILIREVKKDIRKAYPDISISTVAR